MKYIRARSTIAIMENHNINPHYDFNNLSKSDLVEIAKWGLLGMYSDSGCWDEDFDQSSETNLETAIDRALGDFNIFLGTPYPLGLGNIPIKPTIHRLVRLGHKSELDLNKLGTSWFSNPTQYHNYNFYDMLDYLKPLNQKIPGEVYLLTAECTIDNIDVQHTLWQRSIQHSENEIVIIDDSKLSLISCEVIKNFTYL